ncbi:ATP-binding cassette domain-containing protein, partial [Acinetobacter baumannii]|nr:ATP-binding cassette domain-containing protein [Acinetobacter baumannii]
GKNVLENISASIQEGEFVSFVGPSGCGKSTLLNMIANVEKPTSGNVTYNDKQVQEQDVVSYMPQQDLLLPWRSALQNIVLPLEIEGKPKKQRLTEGMEALKQFQLDEYADHYPDELSGG